MSVLLHPITIFLDNFWSCFTGIDPGFGVPERSFDWAHVSPNQPRPSSSLHGRPDDGGDLQGRRHGEALRRRLGFVSRVRPRRHVLSGRGAESAVKTPSGIRFWYRTDPVRYDWTRRFGTYHKSGDNTSP